VSFNEFVENCCYIGEFLFEVYDGGGPGEVL
jgi:hypothetical protein